MSAKRKVKYRDTARAKGAAIIRGEMLRSASARSGRRKGFALRVVLAVVALLEVILMVGFASYSWIESISSLVIRGDNMIVEGNRAYQFEVKSAGAAVDLHRFFYDVDRFLFARATSPDGKMMYFPTTSDSSFRPGDTTDYNINYYCIDTEVFNSTGSKKNYFLKDYAEGEKLFTVTGLDTAYDIGDGSTVDLNTVAENALRLSIENHTSESVLVFSDAGHRSLNVPTAANPAVTTASLSSSTTTPYEYDPDYDEETNRTKTDICAVPANSALKLTFRIWFEFKDYAAGDTSITTLTSSMTDEQKKAFFAEFADAKVTVDFMFKNTDSDTVSFYFDDYSAATFASVEASATTDGNLAYQDSGAYLMYFAYYNTSVDPNAWVYKKMVPTTYDSEHILWRTASDDLLPVDTINKKERENLENDSAAWGASYFFYGTVTGEVGSETPTVIRKWTLDSAPVATAAQDGAYSYIAYGYTGNNTSGYDDTQCFGKWRGSGEANNPTLITFDDKLCDNTAYDYNIGAYAPIGTNEMFLSTATSMGSSNAKNTVRMRYDSASGLFKGYLPLSETDAGDPIVFYYAPNGYGSSYTLKFDATAGRTATQHDYTAYDYDSTGALSSLSSGTGYGTWGDVQLITFSTELIDHVNDPDYRYKITYSYTHSSSVVSHAANMAGAADNLSMYAYIPADVTTVGFKRYDEDVLEATWADSTIGTDKVFYPIEITTATGESNPRGWWNITVLVDGTRDGLISAIMAEVKVPAATLEYSYDGTTYYNMVKIDDYRWCVPNLDTTQASVHYKFTAYTSGDKATEEAETTLGHSDAVFTFYHEFSTSSGIYYYITEYPQSSSAPETPEEP